MGARARAHHTIHATAQDPVQRFLVAALPHSYFRPTATPRAPGSPSSCRGSFEVVTFDERGVLVARYAVGGGAADLAYEAPQVTWHTAAAGRARRCVPRDQTGSVRSGHRRGVRRAGRRPRAMRRWRASLSGCAAPAPGRPRRAERPAALVARPACSVRQRPSSSSAA